MALLTADDILNKKFTATKFREGYDVVEVDDFLDEVLQTLRTLQSENDDLTAKLGTAEQRVAELTREKAAAPAAQSASEAVATPEPEPAPQAQPEPEPEPAPQPEPERQQSYQPPTRAQSEPPAYSRANEPESATGMLQLAQKLHDDYVRSGQEEGERLINDARQEGERIVRDATETSERTLGQLEQERALLERKIDELRQFERDYRTRLHSYLESLLSDLDNRGGSLPERGGADRAGI